MRGLHCPSQSISPTRSVANALYVNVIMLGFSGFRDIYTRAQAHNICHLLLISHVACVDSERNWIGIEEVSH